MVDIVAFVSKGDFPRSRLGEKQRGKILASWVTRKMRTIAQFAIRDQVGEDGVSGRTASVVRNSTGSATMVSQGHDSLRSKHSYPSMQQQQAPAQYMSGNLKHNVSQSSGSSNHSLFAEYHTMSLREAQEQLHNPAAMLPQNELHLDLPATYPTTSFLGNEPSELPTAYNDPYNGYDEEDTPTASPRRARHTDPARAFVHELSAGKDGAELIGYTPFNKRGPFAGGAEGEDFHHLASAAQSLPGSLLPPAAIAELRGDGSSAHHYGTQQQSYHRRATSSDEGGGLLESHAEQPPPVPSYANKPYLSMLSESAGVDSRMHTSPSTSPRNTAGHRSGNGLQVVNAAIPSQSSVSLQGTNKNNYNDEGGQWPLEALAHMGITQDKEVKRKSLASSK